MKKVHVECYPDEALMKKLGFTAREVVHHAGKSRVFNKLRSSSNQLAMVDEDPGSARTHYESSLQLVTACHGMKLYADSSGNNIIVLNGKLED